MQQLPTVTLNNIYYKQAHQIKISFKYNTTLIQILNKIPNATWSRTLKSWYIKNTSQNLHLLHKVLENKAKIYDKNLSIQKYPEKRIRNLSDFNKNLLNNFYKYLKGKRYSKSTIDTYTLQIADFVEYYNTKLNLVTNKDVELFIEDIYIERNYSISTQRQFISALKLFILYYPKLNINNLELARPKQSKKLPIVLSQADILNLISNTNNLKHKTIITLLYSRGLRISELINLQLKDISLDRKQIHVQSGKGRKDRIVSIADHFIPMVVEYYRSYKPKIYLFEGINKGKYSAQSVRQFITKSCKKAKLNKPVTPHTLRHSYATHLLENGVDIRYIQSLLGHAKPETTMIYTHVQRKDLMSISNPLDIAIQKFNNPNKTTKKLS
ncbi:site-specific tyrosine recombinase/integron integrase [uncultured Olleya sp.]|uniref:site-specific tyrosine recombinase/integron integrase n=1 Tax=uncultured Olleya sp. TaxID=757243 RepID=UPI0025941419|nr:site-specific tyrosine recombinase/integron integrase [uncultured Olleya sp.]